MILWRLLAAVRRRPLLLVAGVGLTLLLAHQVRETPSVWTTRVSLLLIAPEGVSVQDGPAVNPLLGERPSLVPLAGVVARSLDAEGPATRSGSDTLSLVGLGVRHGYTISLPNAGGQWNYEFRRPELDVQVVGRSKQDAVALLSEARNRIELEVARQQVALGVDPRYMVTVQQSPLVAVVTESSGNPRKASLIATVLGLLLVLALVVSLPEGLLLPRWGSMPAGGRARRARRTLPDTSESLRPWVTSDAPSAFGDEGTVQR